MILRLRRMTPNQSFFFDAEAKMKASLFKDDPKSAVTAAPPFRGGEAIAAKEPDWTPQVAAARLKGPSTP